MARREDKEAAKKGNFLTSSNSTGNPNPNQQIRNNTNETSDWTHRNEQFRERPT